MSNPRKFSISPRAGRSTVSLYTHPRGQHQTRTPNCYEGSFPRGLDPAVLEDVQAVRPGDNVHGLKLTPKASISLDAADVAVIRSWLTDYGTHPNAVEARQARAAVAEASAAAERAALVASIENEVRQKLADERQRHETAQMREDPMEWLLAAEAALDAAADALRCGVEQARSEGEDVTAIRSTNTDPAEAVNRLDRYQALANRVRRDAVARFEDACKACGLMASRRSASS